MYLHENPEEMAQLVADAAEHFSRAEAYVLKDYYATTDLLYDEMPYEEAVQALRDVADFVAGVDWS